MTSTLNHPPSSQVRLAPPSSRGDNIRRGDPHPYTMKSCYASFLDGHAAMKLAMTGEMKLSQKICELMRIYSQF